MKYYLQLFIMLNFIGLLGAQDNEMLWGQTRIKSIDSLDEKFDLFEKGNYAMFIHWGLFSHLGGIWKDTTYYGVSEWLMSHYQADIPPKEYMVTAKAFNPKNFNAKAIVDLALNAGMKNIVITSKHHDGFAMFDSKYSDFNIVQSTPYAKDPMKELSEECEKSGIGLGFYYSHNIDWTFPGATMGPKVNENGDSVGFDYYFEKKCLPQVNEITSNYGDISLVWFDTPGGISPNYAKILVETVRKNQPNALISGRVGHGLGDYETLGDMKIPDQNIDGLWESVDVTNDSWAYAWYDKNWKNSKTILKDLISTIARGGTYMLNIGPLPDGSIPEVAAISLEEAGKWIEKYPFTIYDAKPSPWRKALPWGDAVINNEKLYILVYDWPQSGKLNIPGIDGRILNINLMQEKLSQPLTFNIKNQWLEIDIPFKPADPLISVIELELDPGVKIDHSYGIDPDHETILLAELSKPHKIDLKDKRWMEKFGEWNHLLQASPWKIDSEVAWEIDVKKPGYYQVDINYTGVDRLVWKVENTEGDFVQNQQNSSHLYNYYPLGLIKFENSGKTKISCKLIEGNFEKASLYAIRLKPF